MAGKKMETGDIKMEDVLESAGGYGFFQKVLSFLTLFPQFTAAMIILSPVFTGSARVELYCQGDMNDTTLEECTDFNCTTVGPGLQPVYSSIVQEWHLVCSKSWIVDVITSCQMAGMMTGALVSSIISDRFGRTKSYLFITLGMGLLGMLPALAFNPISYAIARYLTGVGMGGCFVCLLCPLMEFLTPNWRIICGCVNLWPPGEMLLGLLAYYVPSWRYLTVVGAAPTFLVFLFFPFIQESPRWLLTRKRTEEAHQILCKVAKWNGKPPPVYSTIEALQVTVLKEEKDVMKGVEAMKQMIFNKDIRLQLVILTWANVACAIIYYGVSFSAKSLSGDPHLNMLYMGLLDFFAIPSVLMYSNRVGRRLTFFLNMVFGSIFLFTILILNFTIGLSQTPPIVITVLALLGRFGIVAAWCSLGCTTLESFPTTMRASCLGFTVFAGYLGGIAAPSLPLLGKIAESVPYILYSFLAITSAISSWFLCDMVGEPLKDSVKNSKH